MRRLIAVACASWLALCHGEAAAQESACVRAFDQAQEIRQEGKLLAARDQLAICAAATCPAQIVSKCVPWLEEVEAEIPTVVFAAKDGAGNDITDVQVRVGEAVIAEQLDGRAIALDPGPYTLTFQHADDLDVEVQVLVQAGTKNRLVVAEFVPEITPAPLPPPPAPALPPPPKKDTVVVEPVNDGVSPWIYAGFTVGGVALLTGIITGSMALAEASAIDDACSDGFCPPDQGNAIDRSRAFAIVADVSFILAALGTVVGVVALLTDDDGTSVSFDGTSWRF